MLDTVILFETHVPETAVLFDVSGPDTVSVRATKPELQAAVAANTYTVDGFRFDSLRFNVAKSVTDLETLLSYKVDFNLSIGHWDVSRVSNLRYMFAGCSSFDQPLGNWDVSSATQLDGLFEQTPFNQDISGWDTSACTNMLAMFSQNAQFNQPIGSWNVGRVKHFDIMFRSCSNFDQDLSAWDLSSATNLNGMFNFSGLSPENYARTLIGWANRAYNGGANDGLKANLLLGASSVKFATSSFTGVAPAGFTAQFTTAQDARNFLVNTMGWTITDAGVDS